MAPVKKTKRFRVLTLDQYERLTPGKRLAYIEEALRQMRLAAAVSPAEAAATPNSTEGLRKAKRGRRVQK